MNDAPNTRHPRDEANFVSKVTLWWSFSLLWKGYCKPLNHEDLYRIRDVEKSEQRTELLEEKWREEKLHAQVIGRKPKLWRALLRYFSWQEYGYFLPFGLVCLVGENLRIYGTITLLHKLTAFNDEALDEYFVYIYAIALGSLMKHIGETIIFLHSVVLGVRARAAILGSLYKKALVLSTLSLDRGHLMELVCNDSQRIFTGADYFVPTGIRQLLLVTCFLTWLIYIIGWSCIPSLIFLLALGISRLLLNGFDYELRKKASQLSAERLGVIRQTLAAIYTVKLNCWETIYEEKIQKTRWQEVKSKAKRWMIMLTTYSFISCGQHVGTFITVLVLAFTQIENIQKVNFFALMFILRVMTNNICMSLPTVVRNFTDLRSALVRVEIFLQQDENLNSKPHQKKSVALKNKNHPVQGDNSSTNTQTSNSIDAVSNIEMHEESCKRLKNKLPHLYLSNVSCMLPEQNPPSPRKSHCMEILTGITFQRDIPGLILICGPVGSGKSSLLATILGGELMITSGVVKYAGTLAYVSDTPWVFPGTIRENILFHLPYNEKLYSEVIRACELEKDFKTFTKKDLARIGHHGTTLSGGQRTRIALARAAYSQADIYLLDDPMSSLDAKVAENIFRNCIQGLLSGKIVLLTTHNSRYFVGADQIVHLRDGKIEDFKVHPSNNDLASTQKSASQDEKVTENNEYRDYNKEKNKKTTIPDDEERGTGRVELKVYKNYLLLGAWPIVCFIVVLVFFSGQGIVVLVDFKASRLPESAVLGGSIFEHALLVYTLCLVAAVLLMVLGTLSIFLVLMNAAYQVHNKMVTCVIKVALSFHASHPVGQILNRFSQDINSLDEVLPFYVFISFLYIGRTTATIILAAITNPLLIIPVLISLPIYYILSKIYFTSAGDMKRLMSIAGSPVYSHFSNTINGMRNIRVYGRQTELTDELFRCVDEHHRAVLCTYTATRLFSNILFIITLILSLTVIVCSITDSKSAALGAVTILYAVNVIHPTDWLVRVLGEVNSQMTSAERVLEYTRIQPEGGQDLRKTPPSDWPNIGEIEMKNVSLWYKNDGPFALVDITFKINASEKIGIVGRTGAGKSSLIAAVMRLAETRGEVLIDGLNINDFDTISTRKCVSVISQSPALISGTVRLNIDPLKEHTDAEIWNVLHRTKMTTTIQNLPKALDSEVSDDNSNFSIGQKQLLNLARILLQNNKIVIFDEATGKVDGSTDQEIQRIIRVDLQECTILTISHRLDTILDCDRVMVLDQGEIKEFDSPAVLLNKPDGLLKQLKKVA